MQLHTLPFAAQKQGWTIHATGLWLCSDKALLTIPGVGLDWVCRLVGLLSCVLEGSVWGQPVCLVLSHYRHCLESQIIHGKGSSVSTPPPPPRPVPLACALKPFQRYLKKDLAASGIMRMLCKRLCAWRHWHVPLLHTHSSHAVNLQQLYKVGLDRDGWGLE